MESVERLSSWHGRDLTSFWCQTLGRAKHSNRQKTARRRRISFLVAAIIVTLALVPTGVSSSNQPLAGAWQGRDSTQISSRKVQGEVTEVQSVLPAALTEEHARRVYASMAKARAEGTVWMPLGLPEQGAAGPEILDKASSGSNMMQLVNCLNDQYVPKNMTWAAAMADDLASTKVVGAWWTTKQRRVPLTVVTQSTVDRIPQLYSQCKSWRGPLSVVLYQALSQETLDKLTPENEEILRTALLQVSGFFEDIEQDSSACMPDILLVYEIFTEKQATMLYPINLLRNLARLQARTPMLALVDVDMLLSDSLYSSLLSPSTQQMMIQTTQSKAVYVLPAFETYGATHEAAALADMLVGQDKDFLIRAVEKGIAAPFDSKRFILGHNSTNFPQWYRTNTDYKIKYGERYEPWVVVDRHNVPWHDVRFRGYGNNKIQQIAHINASRFQFFVHHSAFIIHRAHKETIMRQRLITSKVAFDNAKARNQPVDRSSVYGHTRTLFDTARELMNAGRFEAVLDIATKECHSTLPWWRLVNSVRKRRASRSVRAKP